MGQIFVIIALSLVLFAAPSRAESQLERGRYLVETVAACGNCHTPKGPNGPLTNKKTRGRRRHQACGLHRGDPKHHARSGDRHRQMDRPRDICRDTRRTAAGRHSDRSGDAVSLLSLPGGRRRRSDRWLFAQLAAGPEPGRFPGASLGMTIHAAGKGASEVGPIGDPVLLRWCHDATDRRPPRSRQRFIVM